MTLTLTLSRLRMRAVRVGIARRGIIALAAIALGAELAWAAGLPVWRVIAPALVAGAAWAVITAWRHAPTQAGIARQLDAVAALGDLVSTAIDARAAGSPLHALVVRDAARAAAAVPPARVFPFAWPQPGRAVITLVVLVQVGVAAWRWSAPERTTVSTVAMPGLASATPEAPATAGAPAKTPESKAPDDLPAPRDAATPGRADAVTPAASDVQATESAGRAGGSGAPGTITPAGATAGSRRIPAAYREIVERYFSALRSSRAPAARASGKDQP